MALTKIDDRGLKTPIDLKNDEKIRFGNGTDLEVYHTGSHGYIDNSTGSLIIRTNVDADVGGDIFIKPHDDETAIAIIHDNAVQLFYNGVGPKFETTSVGADVKHAGDARFYVKDTTNSETFGIRAYNGNTEVGTHTDHDWKIHRNNAHTATITSSGIDVLAQTVHLYNSANTSNTYFVAQNTSTGNAGIKMKNSQGEWLIIANDNLRFYDADNSEERLTITPTGNVHIGDGDLVVANGHGIDFSNQTWTSTGNTNAEVLDHYEEGTFVPTLGGSSSDPTQSYATQRGSFVRIGNLVHVSIDVQMAASGITAGSGTILLGSLPFAKGSHGTAGNSGGGQSYGVTFTAGLPQTLGVNHPTAAYMGDGVTYMHLMKNTTDGWGNANAAAIANGTRLLCGASYITTA